MRKPTAKQRLQSKNYRYVIVVLGILLVGVAAWILTRGNMPRHTTIGTTTHTIKSNNDDRTYRLYTPALTPDEAPLVIMLHGALGTGRQAESDYGWNTKADTNKFVVAYPDGLNRTWNAGEGCCGPSAKNKVDDVRFIKEVVADISSKTSIDSRRIYVAGISNGGALAYRLACETNIFAAIGPDSTNMLVPCQSPKPISVMHIHGTADQTFPYAGGPGKRSNDGTGKVPADTSGPAIPDILATWRKTNQCANPVTTVEGEVTTSLANCPHGRAVALVTIEGAGHQWPGGVEQKTILKLDKPSAALNATDTLWKFFYDHPKN